MTSSLFVHINNTMVSVCYRMIVPVNHIQHEALRDEIALSARAGTELAVCFLTREAIDKEPNND